MTFWKLFCFCNEPKEKCDAEAQTVLCNEDQKEVQIQKPRKHPDVVITIGSIFRIIVKRSNIFYLFLVDVLNLRAREGRT